MDLIGLLLTLLIAFCVSGILALLFPFIGGALG